jgi:hypothetical protein
MMQIRHINSGDLSIFFVYKFEYYRDHLSEGGGHAHAA